jgi:hypothetical protein
MGVDEVRVVGIDERDASAAGAEDGDMLVEVAWEGGGFSPGIVAWCAASDKVSFSTSS